MKKQRSERAKAAANRRRIRLLREARAILAVAAVAKKSHPKYPQAPSYTKIAEQLGLPRAAADEADEIWNAACSPGDPMFAKSDYVPESEECALERANDLLGIWND